MLILTLAAASDPDVRPDQDHCDDVEAHEHGEDYEERLLILDELPHRDVSLFIFDKVL